MTHSNDNSQHGAKSIVEYVGALVGGTSAAALALSVLYDYGFLRALGLHFGEIHTTLVDHLRSAIVWVPGFLATWMIGTLLGIGLVSVHRASAGNENLRTTKWGLIFSVAFKALDYLPYVLMLPILWHLILDSASIAYVFMGVGVGWLALIQIVTRYMRQRADHSSRKWMLYTILVVPFTASFIVAWGAAAGESLTRNPTVKWTVEIQRPSGLLPVSQTPC